MNEAQVRLINYIRNNPQSYNSLMFAIRHLRRTVCDANMKLNRETRIAHYVAPQTTMDDRNQVIIDLVRYYVTEPEPVKMFNQIKIKLEFVTRFRLAMTAEGELYPSCYYEDVPAGTVVDAVDDGTGSYLAKCPHPADQRGSYLYKRVWPSDCKLMEHIS